MDNLETFVSFCCPGQSGHTIVAAILDSHPNCMIADELRPIWRKWPKEKVLQRCYEDSKNRVKSKKTYRNNVADLSNLYKGTYAGDLKVLGCKCGWDVLGPQLDKKVPDLGVRRLKRFEAILRPIQHKIIHCVRNPFDIVANWNQGSKRKKAGLRGPEGLLNAVNVIEKYSRAIWRIYYREGFDILKITNEDLCSNPKLEIEKICNFLDLPIEKSWLNACVKEVKPVHRRVNEIAWNEEAIERLNDLIRDYHFYESYSTTSILTPPSE